jgi:DNA-binding transcriptional ArsR family regulator
MSEEKYTFDNPMHITLEQSKLLASAIRTQILEAIGEVPRTAKQVADLLRKTPGNVHYHIQRLYEGGLLELVETREVGGVVEKYYKAKSKYFTTDPRNGQVDDIELSDLPHYNVKYSSSHRSFGRLMLSEAEKQEAMRRVNELFAEFAARPDDPEIERVEYSIALEMLKVLLAEEVESETDITEDDSKKANEEKK